MRAALAATQYDGVTGLTKFDAHGGVDKPFAVDRVQDGEFRPVKRGPGGETK